MKWVKVKSTRGKIKLINCHEPDKKNSSNFTFLAACKIWIQLPFVGLSPNQEKIMCTWQILKYKIQIYFKNTFSFFIILFIINFIIYIYYFLFLQQADASPMLTAS